LTESDGVRADMLRLRVPATRDAASKKKWQRQENLTSDSEKDDMPVAGG